MTDRESIRLECLKLRHRHDRQVAEIIVDVRALEVFIREPQEETNKELAARRIAKKADKPAL